MVGNRDFEQRLRLGNHFGRTRGAGPLAFPASWLDRCGRARVRLVCASAWAWGAGGRACACVSQVRLRVAGALARCRCACASQVRLRARTPTSHDAACLAACRSLSLSLSDPEGWSRIRQRQIEVVAECNAWEGFYSFSAWQAAASMAPVA
jgi:hypothetical protein